MSLRFILYLLESQSCKARRVDEGENAPDGTVTGAAQDKARRPEQASSPLFLFYLREYRHLSTQVILHSSARHSSRELHGRWKSCGLNHYPYEMLALQLEA